jgi:hypothetical protein
MWDVAYLRGRADLFACMADALANSAEGKQLRDASQELLRKAEAIEKSEVDTRRRTEAGIAFNSDALPATGTL